MLCWYNFCWNTIFCPDVMILFLCLEKSLLGIPWLLKKLTSKIYLPKIKIYLHFFLKLTFIAISSISRYWTFWQYRYRYWPNINIAILRRYLAVLTVYYYMAHAVTNPFFLSIVIRIQGQRPILFKITFPDFQVFPP